jgi:hypothetical protein
MTGSAQYIVAAPTAAAYAALEDELRARGAVALEPDARHLRLTFRPGAGTAATGSLGRCAVVDVGHGLSKLVGIWDDGGGSSASSDVLDSLFVAVEQRLVEDRSVPRPAPRELTR